MAPCSDIPGSTPGSPWGRRPPARAIAAGTAVAAHHRPKGHRRPAAKPGPMADATPNSVTRDDLRDALSSRGRKRPTSLLAAEPAPAQAPAWEWDAALPAGERLELDELRQVVAEQREHLDRLTAAEEAAAVRERELRDALYELADAGIFARRRVLASLRSRGVL